VPSSDPAKGMGISISKATLDSEPLSKPITPTIDRINLASISTSVVHYHKNKIYFCVPLNDEVRPRHILVYDSLVNQFVSIDSLPVDIMDIKSLEDKLYILSPDAVYLYEDSDSDDGTLIQSKLETRNYVMGSRDIKNFISGSYGYSAKANVNINVSINTFSPDSSTPVKSITTAADTADTLDKFNIKQRGYSASVVLESNGGECKFKRTSVQGYLTGRTEGTFDGN
jgi:hypothetical protein